VIPLLYFALGEIFFFELIVLVAIIRGGMVKTEVRPLLMSLFFQAGSPEKKDDGERTA
jgi:hypothetical protein